MPDYVNGGAVFAGKQTKATLKFALKNAPATVSFYSTSSMGPQFNGPASNLPDDIIMSIVGPDPYSKRTWYASVQRNKKGGLTVS